MDETKKVPVSERALIQRIGRALAKNAISFRKTREPYVRELGRYYSVDSHNNICNPGGDDLEAIGRSLGVLKPYEYLQ